MMVTVQIKLPVCFTQVNETDLSNYFSNLFLCCLITFKRNCAINGRILRRKTKAQGLKIFWLPHDVIATESIFSF